MYRPHIDGSWPGSGIDPNSGEVVDDIYQGSCVSKLTFLIYLNSGRLDEGENGDCDFGDDGEKGSNGVEDSDIEEGIKESSKKLFEETYNPVDPSCTTNEIHDDADVDESFYPGEEFFGGETTFYLPGVDGIGHIDAISVLPQAGSVLVFPHGDVGSLVHEGTAVRGSRRSSSEDSRGESMGGDMCQRNGVGRKYVIRTDVLYSVE